MSQVPKRRRLGRPFALPPPWNRATFFLVGLGVIVSVVTVLLEEKMAALAACVPLAAIPLLAAPLFWIVHIMFKHAAPRVLRADGTQKEKLQCRKP